MSKLSDPWFEASFIRTSPDGSYVYVEALEQADGVTFWCPCGYGKPEYPLDGARPHAVNVSFANPRGVPPATPNAGSCARSGQPSRWTMSGTGLHDLTLSPSIDVGTPSCWHGWITDGVVR